MDKETAEKIVNGRNIMALKDGMNENRKRISDNQTRIEELNTRITTQDQEIQRLKSLVNALLQRSVGTGPTA